MQHVSRVDRSATATWTGSTARGRGELSVPSAALRSVPFTLPGRTGPDASEGTSPEELLAAAHAGCFAMALATQLTRRGAPPELLTVIATASLDQVEGKNRIVASALAVDVGAALSADELEGALREADERCTFSALLRDAGATVTATLLPRVRS